MNKTLLAVAVVALAGAAQPVAAQTSWPAELARRAGQLRPGTQVRLIAPAVSETGISVRLVGVRGDSIVVSRDGREQALELFRVERVDVWGGRNRVQGAAIGLVLGAAVGTSARLFAVQTHNTAPLSVKRNSGRYVQAGAVGALAGVVLGALSGTAHWVPRIVMPMESQDLRHTPIGVSVPLR